MTGIKALACASILSGFSFLSACGDGSAGDSRSSGLGYIPGYGFENSGYDCTGGGEANATPGGFWYTSGIGVYVDESGAFRIVRLADGSQDVGTLSVSGNAVSAAFAAFPKFGSTFSDGSFSAAGTLHGTFVPGATLDITDQITTANGTTSSESIALTFDLLYNCSSSLSFVSGNYYYNFQFSVSGAGSLSGRDPNTGCSMTGTVSIIDRSYNLYNVSYTASNCTGQSTALNGAQFSGFAYVTPYFYDSMSGYTSPPALHVLLDAQVGGTTYAENF